MIIKYKKYLLGGFFLLLVANLLVKNHSTVLWDEDEAAYAGIAMNMVQTNDWMTQSFLYSEIHRKPPLHFWMIAISYKLFGVNEFALRLPGVLSILLCLGFLYYFGKKLYDEETGLIALLVLGSTLLIPNLAKMALTDNALLLFETTAVLSLWTYLKTGKAKWNYLCWGAVSLGVLVKGPPILVLILGLWGFILLFSADRKKLIGTHPWIFLPLSLLPLLIWGWISWQKDGGEFVRWLLDWYILKRASAGGVIDGQSGPPGYHLGIMVGAFLPYLPFVFLGLWAFVRRLKNRALDDLVLAGWFVFAWIFFELMPSKLPSYALAAHPALAITVAQEIKLFSKENYIRLNGLKVLSAFHLILVFFIMMFLIAFGWKFLGEEGLSNVGITAISFWALSFATVVCVYGRKPVGYLATAALSGMILTLTVWMFLMPYIEGGRNISKKITEELLETTEKETEVVFALSAKITQPSMPFYVGKHFPNAYEEKNLIRLSNMYLADTNRVFIMGNHFKTILENNIKPQNRDLDNVKEIQGWVIDGLESEAKHWIIYNYEVPLIHKTSKKEPEQNN